MLVRFWLRRFALVLAISLPTLGLVEYLRAGGPANPWSVLGWGIGAAVFAASVATYWAYRRACPLPDQAARPQSDGAHQGH